MIAADGKTIDVGEVAIAEDADGGRAAAKIEHRRAELHFVVDQHGQAGRRVNLAVRAIALDERHFRHRDQASVRVSAVVPAGPACAAARVAAAYSISASEVKRPMPIRKVRPACSGVRPRAVNT